MPTVYVVNKGGHDYTPAEQYGHLFYLSEGAYNRYGVNRIYREFAMHLRTSTPDDYILITSLTVMSCIACACFTQLHGKLNILLYKNGRYVERKLDTKQLLSSVTMVEDDNDE